MQVSSQKTQSAGRARSCSISSYSLFQSVSQQHSFFTSFTGTALLVGCWVAQFDCCSGAKDNQVYGLISVSAVTVGKIPRSRHYLGSIHFSLLSGRILLKDLKYHSSNQSIRVVKGQISWRYWIRAPAGEEDLSHARVVGEDVGSTFGFVFLARM